jgi:tetratricopeptide (TPR) repeat protein
MRSNSVFVRFLVRSLLGLMLFAGAIFPAFAETDAERGILDKLFAELKNAPDAETAHAIDQQIWMIWTLPAEPGLAGRMAAVLEARRVMDLSGALALLDKLVVDFPDYAEGWNQRATIYYMLDNFEASLADIDKVLALEPRHFGALSGQAMIYLAEGKRALALKAISTALQYHPFLSEKQLFPELEKEMTRI